jgi:hypothetical protein
LVITENGEYSRPSLLISRDLQAEVSLKRGISLSGVVYEKLIYAIIGVIQLISGPHLIVANSVVELGQVDGHSVYSIKAVDIIPGIQKSG